VPFTAPGDIIDAVVANDRGTVVAMVSPAADRISPFCPHFGRCGGCALQHLGAATYAQFKRRLVATPLERAGLTTEVRPLVDVRGTGRRRATLHARRGGAGFMVRRTHDIHDIDQCPILVPALKDAPDIARAVYAAIGVADVTTTATDTGIDVAIRAEHAGFGDKLVPLMARWHLARITLNGETIVMDRQPELSIGRASVRLPPTSFVQATAEAENRLATLVANAVAGARSIADLFCGIGPFALRLAESARIHAVDSDRAAIAALSDAVRHASGLKPIDVKTRDLFRDPLTARELDFDAVVFDPPRAGAEAQARELAQSRVPRVVAVSCDPHTFARDASILVAGGYRLDSVTPLDQFAYSPHVEIVGAFAR
jgi:23S rRNA (uracil1939-C5)-methyltransferase